MRSWKLSWKLMMLAVGLMVTAGYAWGLSPRTAVATPAVKAPVIDGKLDDDCWKSAGVVTDFISDRGTGLASDATEVRLTFDDKFLYLGVTCMESDWTTVKSAIRDRDGSLYNDDDLEIFFDTNQDRKSYYKFILNLLGTQGDALNGNSDWNCDWQGKVVRQADRWTAEIALPLSILGKAAEGAKWGFNIGRGQPGKSFYASFAGALGKWDDAGTFATLSFAAKAAGEGRLFPERKGYRLYLLSPERALDFLSLPAAGTDYSNTYGTPGEYVPYTFHVLNLEAKGDLTVRIAATEFRDVAGNEIAVPEQSILYLYSKIAGDYPWAFLGPGNEITVRPGQSGGFWLDLKVPENAKSAIYQATVTLKLTGDGVNASETRGLRLMVLPFKLDENPVSCGFDYSKEPLPQMRESFQIMREHGMTTVAAYGGYGVNDMETYVKLMDEYGFPGARMYPTTMYIGDRLANSMNLPHRGPMLRDSNRTWQISDEFKRRYVAEMKQYLDEAKRLGHPEMCFSLGDELTSDGRWGAQHLIDRAKALREGLPDIVTTSDAIGYLEIVGASPYLNRVGINDGWGGPDNHNGNIRCLTPKVLQEIMANGCKPEFVNTGNGRFPFGFYLWRMHRYGIFSKIEWIWSSSRLEPAWLNVYREGGKTFVTVSLKQDRIGTYDVRYAVTLENLLKRHPDAAAQQFLDDVVAHIPVAVAEAYQAGWDSARNSQVRWETAKHIMRLTGKSIGVSAPAAAPVGATLDAASSWTTLDMTRQFVRHASRSFVAPEVVNAPVLDGKLDEPVWQQAQLVTGAYDDADLSLASGLMAVRLLHTKDGLYVGVSSHEPDVAKLSWSTKGRDDSKLWQVDDVEIFLDPGQTHGDYYHLVYDLKGTQTDYKKQDIAWNADWKVASQVGTDAWTSEVFIPFAELGSPDKPWGIEVGRGSPTRGAYYGIMPIKGSWHDTTQFGTLTFGKLGPYLADVDPGALKVGDNRATFTVVNPAAAPLEFGVKLVTAEGDSSVSGTVPAGGSKQFSSDFKLGRSGEQNIELVLAQGKSTLAGNIVDRQAFIAQVPELMTLELDDASLFSDSPRRSGAVTLNVPKDKLGEYALEIPVLGKQALRLAGNRLAFLLEAPGLTPGKHRLEFRLVRGGKVEAVKTCDFFVTVPPDFGK